MVRHAMFLGLALCLVPAGAMAGQASANFTVGISIGGGSGQPRAVKTYTWGAAAVSVRQAGYDNPRRVAQSDTLYWFEAQRSGSTYRIGVSISSGEIVKVIPA
jgi:hypothetical protein